MKAISFLLCLCGLALQAQPPAETDRSFLTVLVIPYTGPQGSVRETIEKSDACRALLGRINQVFEERGYRTKDHMALLKLPQIAPTKAELERTEIKEAIKNARVDVVVYAEIEWREFAEGDRQLGLRLQAIDLYSAENYANNVAIESNRRQYQQMQQAINDHQFVEGLNGFADQMDRKLVDVLKNGRAITVKVSIKPGSRLTLDVTPDGCDLNLGGMIDQWVRKHVARIYTPGGDDQYWEAECKLRSVNAEQQMVTPFSFGSDLKKYISQLRCSNIPVRATTGATINTVIEIIVE